MSPPPSDTAFQRFVSSLLGCSLPFRLFLRGRKSYAAWATVYQSNSAHQGCQADGQPPVVEKPEPQGCFVGGCPCGSGSHARAFSMRCLVTLAFRDPASCLQNRTLWFSHLSASFHKASPGPSARSLLSSPPLLFQVLTGPTQQSQQYPCGSLFSFSALLRLMELKHVLASNASNHILSDHRKRD